MQESLHLQMLTAGYRIQMNEKAFLADPQINAETKLFYDPATQVRFTASWLPHRGKRANANTYIAKGLMRDADTSELINDECALCAHNISLKFAKQVLINLNFNDEMWVFTPNPAWSVPYHYTLMPLEHRPQIYEQGIVSVGLSVLDKVGDNLSIIYNGDAGASIKEHIHLQAFPSHLPVEDIAISQDDCIFSNKTASIYVPEYDTPVLITEGHDRVAVEKLSHEVASQWLAHDERNTLNLLFTRTDDSYRVFLFLRDRNRIIAEGKSGMMASFEVGGMVVLSEDDERPYFEDITLAKIKHLIRQIAPDSGHIRSFLNNYLKQTI